MTERILAVLLLGAACGGPQVKSRRAAAEEGFECRGRRAEYTIVGGFVAPEAGISLVCDGDRPNLIVWRVETGDQRSEQNHPITALQFEETWEKLDSTGWRYLDKECPGSTVKAKRKKGRAPDPIYTMDVSDRGTSASITCGGVELPFPYNQLVNELDLLAAGFGDQPGGPR